MKTNKEKIFSIIIVVLLIIFSINRYLEDRILEKDGFFTVGRVSSISFGGGDGWAFKFSYIVKREIYFGSYKGSIGAISKDSLVFLKVSKSDYSLWRLVEDKKVPECVEFSKVPAMGWKAIDEICKP